MIFRTKVPNEDLILYYFWFRLWIPLLADYLKYVHFITW